ncbi:hypothetical protein TNCV_3250791 [Trichonephila clavipes]|nr:hypothetical protein TNCV_3250791 [Trichonephila clavipes]
MAAVDFLHPENSSTGAMVEPATLGRNLHGTTSIVWVPLAHLGLKQLEWGDMSAVQDKDILSEIMKRQVIACRLRTLCRLVVGIRRRAGLLSPCTNGVRKTGCRSVT